MGLHFTWDCPYTVIVLLQAASIHQWWDYTSREAIPCTVMVLLQAASIHRCWDYTSRETVPYTVMELLQAASIHQWWDYTSRETIPCTVMVLLQAASIHQWWDYTSRETVLYTVMVMLQAASIHYCSCGTTLHVRLSLIRYCCRLRVSTSGGTTLHVRLSFYCNSVVADGEYPPVVGLHFTWDCPLYCKGVVAGCEYPPVVGLHWTTGPWPGRGDQQPQETRHIRQTVHVYLVPALSFPSFYCKQLY
jgi:hypothetical protein